MNWKHICRILKVKSECIYPREMAHDPAFKPKITDKILDCWANKGLVTYLQLITKQSKNSYAVIASRYELDQKHQVLTNEKLFYENFRRGQIKKKMI